MKTERKWSKWLLRDGILKDSKEKNQYKLDFEWNGEGEEKVLTDFCPMSIY